MYVYFIEASDKFLTDKIDNCYRGLRFLLGYED